MHIRKLDLQGFKSFPDRTSFHFAPGVSGVVGPNGCGKSNVVDAIKWCLGEQSAKSLRGRSMEDVIFAGSMSRSPVGLAEVTITFESTDEPFPGEWARFEELQVTRRLFRDGNSEYLINQQRVRLKDIHDVFKDTGAGNRLYSFIEQGRIGEIVRARPEQRRTLIEEAAGISRFKSKRKEAQQRLDGTLRNLERATDVTESLSSRLRTLKRQVAKATRYRRYRTVVRQGEIFLGLARFSGLVGDRRALVESLTEAGGAERKLARELARCEEGVSQERAAIEVIAAGIGTARDRLSELEATRRERESARLYQGRESTQLLERIGRLEGAQAQAEADFAAAAESRERAEVEHGQMRSQVDDARVSEGEAKATAEALDAELSALHASIEGHKKRVFEWVRRLARAVADRETSRKRAADLTARSADLVFRGEIVRAELAQQGEVLQGLQAIASAAASVQKRAATALGEADALHVDAQAERGLAREALRGREVERVQAMRDLDRCQTRIEALATLQNAHDGARSAVKTALAVTGTLGTLADQLDVSEDMEDLVATALGDELEYVLVPDAEVALAVAQGIEGRLGMLLLPEVAASASVLFAETASTDIGRSALSRLVGDCREVPDLATALAAHRSNGGAYMVRGSGDSPPMLVTARGEIRIGPVTGGGTAQLRRRRELGALRSELPTREKAMAAAVRLLRVAGERDEAAAENLTQSQHALSTARTALHQAELRHRGAVGDCEKIEASCDHQRAAVAKIEADRAAMETEAVGLAESNVGLGAVIADGQREQEMAETALQSDQVKLAVLDAQARDARQKAVVLATELAGIAERLRGLERIADAARQAEEGAGRQVESCATDIEQARQRISELAANDGELSGELQAIGEEQADVRTRIDTSQNDVRELQEGMRSAEERIRALRDGREAATANRVELERSIEQVKLEIVRIREQLDERYQVSVAALLDRLERNNTLIIEVPEEARGPDISETGPDIAPPLASDDELEDFCVRVAMLDDENVISEWVTRLQGARKRLEGIGEVNLVAVDEYTEVKGRFDQLETQRLDLEESVKAIQHSIAQLNRTCRERFRETFDRVNTLFQEGYPLLVGGGQARLVLTDEEDMLETGVDIEVQPPGKRLQNVTLLSGGETAMAAIALIFALFRVKPSPFCLLDEVDAPLDEANGARFNGLLREMSKLSQFIVITHNKKTMECVDTLYGVTMEQPGVSQLVTVKLD